MTFDELGTALSELEEARKSAERELRSVKSRLERVEQLKRDRDALREDYFGIATDALDSLTPEERHHFYKLVRLRVIIYPNCDLEISWAGGEGLLFSTSETVSGHSNISITLDTYSHVLPNMQKEAARAMEDLIDPSDRGA